MLCAIQKKMESKIEDKVPRQDSNTRSRAEVKQDGEAGEPAPSATVKWISPRCADRCKSARRISPDLVCDVCHQRLLGFSEVWHIVKEHLRPDEPFVRFR